MTTETAAPPGTTRVEEAPPGRETSLSERVAWMRSRRQLRLLAPVLLIPLIAMIVARRRGRPGFRRGRAVSPSVDWKFLSANRVFFGPRLNFHPTLQLGRRR